MRATRVRAPARSARKVRHVDAVHWLVLSVIAALAIYLAAVAALIIAG